MWNILAASATGTSHTKNSTPCQDAHRWTMMETGTLLIAVADGAGSAERSQAGAVCAVEVAISFLEGALTVLVPADEVGWERLLTAAAA
jgi:serine/threonine protein phosphatase PrpC